MRMRETKVGVFDKIANDRHFVCVQAHNTHAQKGSGRVWRQRLVIAVYVLDRDSVFKLVSVGYMLSMVLPCCKVAAGHEQA